MPPSPATSGSSPTNARLAAAQRIAAGYAADPAVAAVLCGGSTGRGHADRWSDLELGVFWTAPPAPAQRGQVVTGLAGQDLRQFGYDPDERAWFDEWWYAGRAGSGLLVEVVHVTTADAHALLDALLGVTDPGTTDPGTTGPRGTGPRGTGSGGTGSGGTDPGSPDPRPYLLSFAAALAYGQALHGSVTPWASRVAEYPRPLAAAAVRRHGQLDHFWRWQMYADRGDPHGLRTHFAAVSTALAHIMCALNGRWWPGPKWPGWTLAGLAICPPRLRERLSEADALAPAAAAALLAGLVEDAYDLVDEHLPEAGADRLRTVFRFTRAPWPP
ncbi:MAG TPA: hypothetical protein VFB84_09890 [Micromonosporaceae bacterium]|nr:hypothetical protein [Micromonosporaceae bacterium]